MALKPVIDEELLKQLESADGLTPVSDPELLKQLEEQSTEDLDPSQLGSFARGAMSGLPAAQTAVSGLMALSPDKTYEQAHKELEDLKTADWEQNPAAYGAGKTAGIVGTALAAPVSLPAAAAIGAGYGLDMATKPADMIKDAAVGSLGGAVMHGVGSKVISPAIESIASGATNLAKRGLASLGKKTTIADIESYLANPNAINFSGTKEQIGQKVADLTGDISTASKHLSTEARGLLGEGNLLNMRNIKDSTMDAVKKYFTQGNIATDADETAVKTIIGQYKRLSDIAEANGGIVPETTLRSMIDRMQAATKESAFGNPEAGASQTALKEFTGKLNDLLRRHNPQYAEAMAPSAEAAGLSKSLSEGFGIEKGVPTDITASKLNNLLKTGKPDEMALAQKLKDLTGDDIVEALQNSQTNERLNEVGVGETLKAVLSTLGFGLGRTSGAPMGGIGGAVAGRATATAVNGGNLAKTIMNMYLSGKNMTAPLQKFAPILIQAAKQGGNSLAATHFVLATSHPEYQKLVEEAQGNPQE